MTAGLETKQEQLQKQEAVQNTETTREKKKKPTERPNKGSDGSPFLWLHDNNFTEIHRNICIYEVGLIHSKSAAPHY